MALILEGCTRGAFCLKECVSNTGSRLNVYGGGFEFGESEVTEFTEAGWDWVACCMAEL